MNPILIQGLTGLPVTYSNSASSSVFAAAGSLIDNFHLKPNWEVWGSGMIQKNVAIPSPLNFHAVRGKLSRAELLAKGFHNVPEVYGDPGLLLPASISPATCKEKKFDIGIIPHTSFRYNPAMHMYRSIRSVVNKKSVNVISPKLNPETFVRKILECQYIYANSLHGIITAMAYKVPCRWINFEGDFLEGRVTSPFIGDTFKYNDFFSALDIDPISPNKIKSWRDFVALEQSNVGLIDNFGFDPEPLLQAFPFKTETFKRKSEWLINHYTKAS